MRLKNKPQAGQTVLESKYCIKGAPLEKYSQIRDLSKGKDIFLEIGCGKGNFCIEMSKLFPNIFFIGVEQYDSVLFSALKKMDTYDSDNLVFLNDRAELLPEIFPQNTVNGIYLNFSDPWPKKRHFKRRLTSERFLNTYHQFLKPGAIIEQKTDNDSLYDFSIEQFNLSKHYELKTFTFDLYSKKELLIGNVPTEYEIKFREKGQAIHKIIAIHK